MVFQDSKYGGGDSVAFPPDNGTTALIGVDSEVKSTLDWISSGQMACSFDDLIREVDRKIFSRYVRGFPGIPEISVP